MRNLIVCCDGTWNTPDQTKHGVPVPSNVVRMYNAVAETDAFGNEQLKYYHPGVGTEGSIIEKALGGGMGAGLDRNIKSAYRWICDNLKPDDRLFLFGFSRGAYTVRSLAGLMACCGILDLKGLAEADAWDRVKKAYTLGYRKAKKDWPGTWPFTAPADAVEIYFIGVWDTVGALGIPDDLALLNLLEKAKNHTFHDTELSKAVKIARHAVALDEMRASFSPTLWTNVEERDVKQIWFPGVHSDVGGGYPETGLSDGALKWMMEEASAKELALLPAMLNQIRPDSQDVLHDSVSGIFKILRTQPRSVPLLDESGPLHSSAVARHKQPPITEGQYRPTLCLEIGRKTDLRIYAVNPWNSTGLYLSKGARYRFTATGEWLDRTIHCGPDGTDDGKFQAAEVAQVIGTMWGKFENIYKRITKNGMADFKGSRRQEDIPWFALVGVIANGGNPKPDGTPEPHETFMIGSSCELTVESPGYLYAFANDAWHFYGNNRGSVSLTVERIG